MIGPTPQQVAAPVICIGNVTIGGSGKTPVALDFAKRLKLMGMNPHFLTRGYGGRLLGPAKVELDYHTSADVGDEALLLTRVAPTWIGTDRSATAIMALKAGANVLIMDDGFQNVSLVKDLSLLVFDGGVGKGNNHLLPAGPLREPLKNALGRADGLILFGEDKTSLLSSLPNSMPKFVATARPTLDKMELKGHRFLAFAGIGRPQKFFDTLEESGAILAETKVFADHHPYSASEIRSLNERAAILQATLITTEKDAVRLQPNEKIGINILTISIHWDDADAIEALLMSLSNRVTHAG